MCNVWRYLTTTRALKLFLDECFKYDGIAIPENPLKCCASSCGAYCGALICGQGQGGVTLRMKAVRVLDLVEYTAGVKWDQEDEGFVQEADETHKETVDSEDHDDDNYEDF